MCELDNNTENLPEFLNIFILDGFSNTSTNPLNEVLNAMKNPWYTQNPLFLKFIINVLKYFSKTKFKYNVEFMCIYLRLEIKYEKVIVQNNKESELIENVGKRIFSIEKNNLTLWMAYARLLIKFNKFKVIINSF